MNRSERLASDELFDRVRAAIKAYEFKTGRDVKCITSTLIESTSLESEVPTFQRTLNIDVGDAPTDYKVEW